MKLIYTRDSGDMIAGSIVSPGDWVTTSQGDRMIVGGFNPPHKPSSEGKVWVHPVGNTEHQREYFVSVIGAKWIEREDREENSSLSSLDLSDLKMSTKCPYCGSGLFTPKGDCQKCGL